MGKIIGTDNIAIGIQNFEQLIKGKYFYIDKTSFIKEWWDSGDSVTLITRPRRFGKTLNMSMLEHFFSVEYAERGDLFEELLMDEEGMQDTENRMIHIGKPIEFDEDAFLQRLDEMYKPITSEQVDVRAFVKEMVSTYQPKD